MRTDLDKRKMQFRLQRENMVMVRIVLPRLVSLKIFQTHLYWISSKGRPFAISGILVTRLAVWRGREIIRCMANTIGTGLMKHMTGPISVTMPMDQKHAQWLGPGWESWQPLLQLKTNGSAVTALFD